MAAEDANQKKWEAQVKTVGFREAAIGFLRDRLYREYEKKRVDRLIRLLSKYEPQQEIVKLLCQNPAWRQRAEELFLELSEVTADPQVQFVFKGAGNVPRVPALEKSRLCFGCGDTFYGLDAQTGEVIWNLQDLGKHWSLAHPSENSVYVSSPGRLHALSPKDGKKLCRYKTLRFPSSPTACRGMVYFSVQGR